MTCVTLFTSPKSSRPVSCSLTENSLLHYKMTNYRNTKYEIGILWNDEDINIRWPIRKPIISLRDKKNITFKEYLKLK